jgi:amidase
MIGIGTDIGGSVRQPAAVTGLYGIRCTVGRIGIGGTRSTMLGNEGILGTAGPLCRSMRDLDLITEVLISGTAGSDPFLTPPLPWNSFGEEKATNPPIRVGVLRHDGNVNPITPIRRAMESVLEQVSQSKSFEIVILEPGDYYRRGWELAREL